MFRVFHSKKIEWLILFIILLVGFFARLYKFNGPIADWHSWRQTDTSAVSRNFVTGGFNLLYPRFDDLSNVPSGLDNPYGYRFVEFPIYNLFQAGGFLLFNHFTLEEWGRLITIFSTLASSLFIFLLVKKYSNTLSAFLSIFFYTFVPFNIYYGRTILPDQLMVTATLGGLYFFSNWVNFENESILKLSALYLVAAIFFAIALLLKPFSAFFFFPAIWVAWKKWQFKIFFRPELWGLLIISVLPFVTWRIWMSSHPEGIPASSWLFNGGNIRFTGAFFHWLFAKRIAELILGYWGLGILVVGVIVNQKNKLFFYASLLSSLMYLFVVARGNVQHDYYQIPIIPTIAMFLGIGGNFLLKVSKDSISRSASILVLIICCLFMFAFSWFEVRDFFNINNPSIVIAGQAVDKLTPPNAKVIAPLDGDTTFLYQTKRKGWASFEKPLEQLIKMGADYLILTSPTQNDLNGFGKKYKIVSVTKDYILFDLHKSP